MKILLLQARNATDPMLRHELECFAQQCGLPNERFLTLNLPAQAWDDDTVLDRVDAVMVGGSGDYSLATGGFHWHDHYLDLMRRVIARRLPTFASCFGFQAIVQALGGRIVKDPSCAEVGTFEISLSDAGIAEPLFAAAPRQFDAQLGHNDSAAEPLPDELLNLAYSERAPVQAIRVRDAPVVATQFHPELSMESNVVRYLRYLSTYNPELDPLEARARSAEIHRPSPVANTLLRRFLDLYVRSAAQGS